MRKALTHLRAADPVMKSIIEKVGPYKIVYREPDYTTLARSIIYQQVSGAAAATVLGRLHAAVARGLDRRDVFDREEHVCAVGAYPRRSRQG